jgi:hypothetical protein
MLLIIPHILLSQKDSSNKSCIKLNVLSLYNVIFDSKKEIRAGVEFERKINENCSSFHHLDAGLYDQYDFYKYYDFFNEEGGLHYTRQHVTSYGVNLIQGVNYRLPILKKSKRFSYFVSSLIDLHYYWKELKTTNSINDYLIQDSYHQFSGGIGLGIGAKYKISKHFLLEANTNMTATLFSFFNKNENKIAVLDAQWQTANYKLWGISHIQLCYAF